MAFTGMGPVFNEFQSLLRAAYNTAQLRTTVQFDKVRCTVFSDIGPRFSRMQNATAANTRSGHAVERRLVSFVNNDQEAQAIVTKVNQEYPNGILAQEFRRR